MRNLTHFYAALDSHDIVQDFINTYAARFDAPIADADDRAWRTATLVAWEEWLKRLYFRSLTEWHASAGATGAIYAAWRVVARWLADL